MNKACEINLSELIKIKYLIKKIKFSKKKSSLFNGCNLTKTYGRGMEYAESRIYQIGDDARHIDWHLSARQTKTYTKLFHEEKGENNYIILDLSSNLFFGTKYYLKSVIASKVAAFLSHLTFDEHGNTGGIIFNDHNIDYIPAKLSQKNINHILNTIVKNYNDNINNLFTYKTINYNSKTSNSKINNIYNIINKFENLINKNNKIFIISDFLNTNDLLVSKIKQLSYKNLIYLIKITDPIELDPNYISVGNYNISNGSDNMELIINKSNQDLFYKYFDNKLKIFNNFIKNKSQNNINTINIIDIISDHKWYLQLINNI